MWLKRTDLCRERPQLRALPNLGSPMALLLFEPTYAYCLSAGMRVSNWLGKGEVDPLMILCCQVEAGARLWQITIGASSLCRVCGAAAGT